MSPTVVSYSKARQNLAKVIADCLDDSVPAIITSRKGKVIMLPYDDWEAEQETLYLLSSPQNAKHLKQSMQHEKDGKTTTFDSIDALRRYVNEG